MSKLPVVSGRDLIKALSKIGYEVVRQRSSHVRLKVHDGSGRKPLTVPLHDPIKPGLLGHIIKDANLTVEELIRLL
ncbi:MAG: type II toxin-antitoxin system HicA family toxin [Thermoplasmata archaeon]|nr:type II toxin-antitoxin system HicA family toxin [Thermoplasmata archaeon]